MIPVFVEVVRNEPGVFFVPFPPVVQGNETQQLELSDCHIRHSSGLCALLSLDSHSHIGSTNHIHVICTVSNCQGEVGHP